MSYSEKGFSESFHPNVRFYFMVDSQRIAKTPPAWTTTLNTLSLTMPWLFSYDPLLNEPQQDYPRTPTWSSVELTEVSWCTVGSTPFPSTKLNFGKPAWSNRESGVGLIWPTFVICTSKPLRDFWTSLHAEEKEAFYEVQSRIDFRVGTLWSWWVILITKQSPAWNNNGKIRLWDWNDNREWYVA